MSKTINISVVDDLGNGIFGAKSYIGNKDGNRLYDRNKGGISDFEGNLTLEVNTLPFISQYVWVKDTNNNYEAKQLYRSSKSSPYKFIMNKKVQEVAETVVIGKRPTTEKKSNRKAVIIIASAVLLGGLLIFIIYKNKK